MSRTGLILLVCISLALPIVAAHLKVDVALVNVVATVTDDTGEYVADLTQDDFIVEEDGKAQTISQFSQSNDLPVSMGVLLDISGNMERKIGTATSAVERFIRSIHRDDDIFLTTFANRPELQQDFTDDRDRLARALRRVRVGGATALYDAVEFGVRKIKDGVHEKKVILLLTDGEDTSSEATFDEVKSAIRESEILVYSLGISPSGGTLTEGSPIPRTNDPRYPPSRNPGGIGVPFPTIPGIPIPGIPGGGRVPGRFPALPLQPQQNPRRGGTRVQVGPDTVDMSVLDAFAESSGGKAFLLSGSWTENRGSEIQNVLDQIASELRNQYSIGYYPPHDLKDGKWHRIQIRAKDRRYHVRARKEYFGK